MKTKIFLPVIAACLFLASCQKDIQSPDKQNPEIASKTAMAPGTALSHTKRYNADVAVSWFEFLANTSRSKPYVPPQTIRILSYAAIAGYESVVPGMPSYQSIFKHLTGETIPVDHKKNYYWPACINAAIARVSSKIFQNYPTPDLAPLEALENSWNNSFQGEATPEELAASIAYGQVVGDRVYDWSVTDGALSPCPPYVPLGNPGNWEPTPPIFLPATGACQGSLRTYIPGITQATFPALPPAYSTDPQSAFYQAMNETYQLRNNLSASEALAVEAWRDNVGVNYNAPSHVLMIACGIVSAENLNLEDAVVFFAKFNMSISDAIGAIFYAKFHPSISLLRPITYIRNVMGHTTWNSVYPTIHHPAYPAIMPAAVGAGVVILEKTFGTGYAVTDSTQVSQYGIFHHESFSEMVRHVGETRILSGHNFRPSVNAATSQGRMVGEMIFNLPFKKP